MKPRPLGPRPVAPIGLGCMNFCWAYRPPLPEAEVGRLLLEALDLGVDHIDTAALYGFGISETLVGRYLAPHRSRFLLASKGGLAGETFPDGVVRRVIDGRPETLRRHVEASLQRLRTDVIDLYYVHRYDRRVPIEESVGALADAVRAGHIRAIGLSEVSAATLERAHAVHPIAAVQSEYSAWSRNVEIGVLDACRRLGAAFVAFSPVARGYLTGTPPDPATFDAKDIRRAMPRFGADWWPRNLERRAAFVALAEEAGCSPAQLALAWVLAQGPHVVAVPGTASIAHLRENAATTRLQVSPALLARVTALFPPDVAGPRYSDATQREIDTEQFPAPGAAVA